VKRCEKLHPTTMALAAPRVTAERLANYRHF
jgi:hypothetical protein